MLVTRTFNVLLTRAPLQEEMLRTAQAQSEEEQLRNALEASCNTAAAAAAEADMVRQAIAESMAAAAASGGGVGAGDAAEGQSGAVPGAGTSSVGHGQEVLSSAAEVGEDEELKRALLLSGLGEEWETPPGGAGAGQGFDYDELQEDPELRLAIKASLNSE